MNSVAFKTSDGVDTITKALDDFLRDKRLSLSAQQYSRLKKLLMVALLDGEMSYSAAYNTLCGLSEYRKDYEIDANAQEEAEEEMIRIIGAADVTEKTVIIENLTFKKPFMIAASLLILICGGMIGAKAVSDYKNQTLALADVITRDEEAAIKDMAQHIADLESAAGNAVTTNAIYNDIKKLDSVKAAGSATSYKKFNQAQYLVAMEYLQARLATLQPAAGVVEAPYSPAQ